MSMPVAKMMNSKHPFSVTPTHPQPNREQASHKVSEFQSGASPSPSSDSTTYQYHNLDDCPVTHSVPQSPLVERGASKTSCDVSLLSYIQRAWHSVWHVINATLLLFSHSVVSDSATPWTVARQASLSFTLSQSLLKLISIESKRPSNHLVLCCPSSCPQSFPVSGSFPMNQLFSSQSSLNKLPSFISTC